MIHTFIPPSLVLKKLLFVLLTIASFACFSQCPTVSGGEIDEGNVTISGSCVLNEDILIKSGNITITGTLTVNGNLEYDVGGKTFLVDGGTVIVTGKFTNKTSGDVTITNGGSFTAGTDGDAADTQNFDNQSSGVITVDGNGSLTVYGEFFNNGNAVTNFLDGTINISGNFSNNGNGNIDSGGTVTVGGDFTQNGNSNLTVSGGLSVGGTLSNKKGDITIEDGAVLKADAIELNDANGDLTIESGGTIASNSITGSGDVVNNAGNADQDCDNGCCGAQCDGTGTMLTGDALVTLPVELLYFNLEEMDLGINIHWATSIEINNDRFVIERSTDGLVFEEINTTQGAGNTNTIIKYSFNDYPKFKGLIFYRMTQVDFDGTSEQFGIKSVIYDPLASSNKEIYPSILKSGQAVSISNFWGVIQSTSLNLVSLSGKRIQLNNYSLEANKMLLSIPSVQKGIYLLQGNINGISVNQRLVIN